MPFSKRSDWQDYATKQGMRKATASSRLYQNNPKNHEAILENKDGFGTDSSAIASA